MEDILKGSAIENYDAEKHFDGWNGSLDIPAIDFYYDNSRYGFEVPNAMLVGIRSNLWDESYRKSNDTNDLKVNLISILKKPLYDSFDDAVKEVEEWNIRFIDSGFTPIKQKYDLSIDEARKRLKEEIKGNQFPTFYVKSLMQDEVIFRLGISRAKNKLKPDSYVYNLNIVVKRPDR